MFFQPCLEQPSSEKLSSLLIAESLFLYNFPLATSGLFYLVFLKEWDLRSRFISVLMLLVQFFQILQMLFYCDKIPNSKSNSTSKVCNF